MATWLDHYPTVQPFLHRPDDVLVGACLEPAETAWNESQALEELRRLHAIGAAALRRLAADQEVR